MTVKNLKNLLDKLPENLDVVGLSNEGDQFRHISLWVETAALFGNRLVTPQCLPKVGNFPLQQVAVIN